ncbi:hypothetical protein I4U23_029868 [Adineta vaga]|nr:hypothetical protein I4U23_029868 [Adineta vaga]
MNSNHKSESTTVYLGNTRSISNDYLREYCSKLGLILDCSRRLLSSSEQAHLVDFTFVRFLNVESYSKFLSISSHMLNNGIILDVRPFDEVLHPAVPLHVDRKICLSNLPNNISLNEIKKYLRTFGTIKQTISETDVNEQKNVYIEFDSAITRNKLLKGKIRRHRIRDQTLNILPFLRPTDVDLCKIEKQEVEMNDDGSLLIHLEREYNLKIRQEFESIENQISDFVKEKHRNMHSSSPNTIYVGNIQSIKDEQLREYFQRFGHIEAFYHNCTHTTDEWLVDYRFIRFSSDTDMSAFLTNKIDHMICRIRLDIHPYQAAFSDQTRLITDRKICIAHKDSKLDRNIIKKVFTKYGRILNCICVSSGHGVEYVYIEFESINSIPSVFANNRKHFANRIPLIVKQALRPSQVEIKMEQISSDERKSKSSQSQMRSSDVDTAQYSSLLVHRHNSIIEEELRTSTPLLQQRQSINSSSSNESSYACSQQQLKDYEHEYELIIRQDFDEMTSQIDEFLRNQMKSYKKIHRYLLDELHSQSSSSESEDGEILSDSETHYYNSTKRLKGHH